MSLKHVILTVLHQGPATGYEILKEFDTVMGYFWNASHQQVYRDLAQLTEAGFVTFTAVAQDHKPDKKVYVLTEAGRDALRGWVEEPLKPQRVQDELLVKLLAGEVTGSTSLMKRLAEERRRHGEKLEVYRRLQKEHFDVGSIEDIPAVERLAYMTLRRGILGEESWLAWADELEVVILSLGAPREASPPETR